MAKKCDVCGRKPTVGFRKSHAHNRTKRIVNLNLQSRKIQGRKRKVCVNCIKTRYFGEKTVNTFKK